MLGEQYKPIEVNSSKRFLLKCTRESSKVAGMSALAGVRKPGNRKSQAI
jgi:hypothetical protein